MPTLQLKQIKEAPKDQLKKWVDDFSIRIDTTQLKSFKTDVLKVILMVYFNYYVPADYQESIKDLVLVGYVFDHNNSMYSGISSKLHKTQRDYVLQQYIKFVIKPAQNRGPCLDYILSEGFLITNIEFGRYQSLPYIHNSKQWGSLVKFYQQDRFNTTVFQLDEFSRNLDTDGKLKNNLSYEKVRSMGLISSLNPNTNSSINSQRGASFSSLDKDRDQVKKNIGSLFTFEINNNNENKEQPKEEEDEIIQPVPVQSQVLKESKSSLEEMFQKK